MKGSYVPGPKFGIFAIGFAALCGIIVLSALRIAVPPILDYLAIASAAALFGVTIPTPPTIP